VEVRVLGPMELVVGSHPTDLGTRMHRALLSLLLMDLGRVVSVDRLVDCMWGEEPPPTATNALQVYVSRLRKILEPNRPAGVASGILVTQSPGYLLRVRPEAVDARRFESMVAEGQALLAAGRPAAAHDVLRLGLGLWRGTAYQDLEFETCVQPEVARLNGLRATAAEAKAEALLAMGRHGEAVSDLDRLVAEDALRERRWGLLALALYRDGRQSDALRALNRARHTLGEELGLELGPHLRRLEREILEHGADLEWRPPVEQPPTPIRRIPMRHASGAGMLDLFPATAPLTEDWPKPSSVLPPDACPNGWSLTDMAAAVAPFTMSGNDPARCPTTPFQILFATDVDLEMVAGGVAATGRGMFTVSADTEFFVPLFSVDDGAPAVAGFPKAPSDSIPYFFDPAQYGGRDFEVVVDGTTTALGPEYLVGPTPLGDEDNLSVLTLAAFVGRLSPGAHTVVARGGVFGRAQADTFGIAFVQEEFTYLVTVLPAAPS
jgi:DNA-binding SARP family transcriptional activator